MPAPTLQVPENFDQAFKLSNDEDAQGTLQYVLGIDVPGNAQFEVLDRELNLNRQHADHLYRVRTGPDEVIHLAEAYTHYDYRWPKSMVEHAVMASLKYDLSIWAHLVLFQKKGTLENVAPRVTVDRGGLQHHLTVNVIRLWERPADEVLQSNQLTLFPWVALMDASADQQMQAAKQVAPHEALRMRMALFGDLRYGSLELFLERIGNMLSVEQLRDWPLLREVAQEARQEGRQEGLLDGQRRMLALALRTKFGTLPTWAEQKIDAATTDEIERWLAAALTGKQLEAILQ